MPKFNAKIVSIGREDLDAAVQDELSNRWSQRRQDIRRVVAEEVENTINTNRDRFQPQRATLGGPETVGILGVGKDGTPDFDKLRNAYKLLIPTQGSTISKLGIAFQRRASRFGRVTFNINLDRFYNADITNYVAPSDGQFIQVPWMQNFIMGVAAPEHAFIDESDPEYRPASSRTGLGHMVRISDNGPIAIPRQQLSYPGVGEEATFGVLLRRIQKRLESRKFIGKVENILGD